MSSLPSQGLDSGLSQIARRNSGEDPKVVWNFPIDVTFKSTNAFGWPRISISVSNHFLLLLLSKEEKVEDASELLVLYRSLASIPWVEILFVVMALFFYLPTEDNTRE